MPAAETVLAAKSITRRMRQYYRTWTNLKSLSFRFFHQTMSRLAATGSGSSKPPRGLFYRIRPWLLGVVYMG